MSLKQVFESRRSVNFFDASKPLAEETLRNIVDLAVTAPSAFNLQPWELIAVKSEEGKQKLFENAFKQPKVLEAPVSIIVVGDRNGYADTNKEWDELAAMVGGRDNLKGYFDMTQGLYGSTEERKVKFAESHGGMIAMSLMAAAEYYGVNSHPMSGIDFAGIKEAFNIGEDKEVVMVITLGYFDTTKELYPRRSRKTFDEVVVLA